MELRQLRYAVQVAEEKSISRAAKKLLIAQPSLSQQIAKLEKELGVLLFNRNSNRIELTVAGESFLEKAVKILDQVEQLSREMADIADIRRGKLAIGSLPMTGSHLLPLILPAFHERYPGIDVVVAEETTSNLERMTVKGQVEICLLSLPLMEPMLAYEVILEEEILLAVPPGHALSKETSITVSRLKNESFIFMKKGQGFRHISMQLCSQAGFDPHIVFESSNVETVQSLVSAGMGVAFVPKMVTRSIHSSFTPQYLRIVDPTPGRTLVIAYRKERYLSKAALAFINIIKEQLLQTYVPK